jgi:membrane protein DedA with SNARE-associated domain
MKELIQQYGAWIVFALVFLESVGLPLPGETVLVSAAIYAGTAHDLSITFVIIGAALGAALGSAVGFWIGDYYGYRLLVCYDSYIGVTETRIKIAQYLFRRRGITVVLVARFVAVLRSIAGFVAGASRMSVARFMVANGAGAVAWALIDGLAGLYLGKGFEKFARPAAIALAVIVAIAIAGVFLYWRRKEQELAAAAERAIPGPLLVRREKVRN